MESQSLLEYWVYTTATTANNYCMPSFILYLFFKIILQVIIVVLI